MTTFQKDSSQIPSHDQTKDRDRANSGTDDNVSHGKTKTTTWSPATKKKTKIYSKLHLSNDLDYVLHARLDQIERILITAPKKAHNQYKVLMFI